MELGASKKSLATLAGLLAVLAFVTYYQFFREAGVTVPQPRPTVGTPSGNAGISGEPVSARPTGAGRSAGRFRPRLGRSNPEDRPDPMTADATLRKGLLERLRDIEEPNVQRDIFNFGRPKPRPVAGPTREEVRQAQARLEANMKKRTAPAPRPPPRPSPPKARPPRWKYYGLADDPVSTAQRGFLLDGEEILVAAEGTILQGRYRIDRIGLDAIVLKDLQADQQFSIQLESSR